MKFKWKGDHERTCLLDNFDRRGWIRTDGDDWNLFWASVNTIGKIFKVRKEGLRLEDNQIISHFPNYYELTKKDLMVRNIKRYVRNLVRQQKLQKKLNVKVNSRENGTKIQDQIDGEFIIPATYLLPTDYTLFVEEFKRRPKSYWIAKPTNGARGRGIFIINKIDQLPKRKGMTDVSLIVSRYVDNPLLIGEKKFDLRIYVLITSFRPLKIYLGDGFARFCNSKYSIDPESIQDRFIHLTNVSIQKQSRNYNHSHGGKWNLKYLRLHLESINGFELTQKLFQDIDKLIIHSAKAVQNVIINDKHCFECYGYDLLIDSNLKPWIIEVNASPSLMSTTASDRQMKTKLINDVIDIVIPQKFHNIDHGITNSKRTGDFVLLYDEGEENDKSKKKSMNSKKYDTDSNQHRKK